MQSGTDWRAFGIGMAAGIALSVCLYFGWTLLRPTPRDTLNIEAAANVPMPLDENALVAANAERPTNNVAPRREANQGSDPFGPELMPPANRVAPVEPELRPRRPAPPVEEPDEPPPVDDEGLVPDEEKPVD